MHIIVSPAAQHCTIYEGEDRLASFDVSTSRYGLGEEEGSHCTPRGRFRIIEKIGDAQPAGMRFVGRKPTGEIIPHGEHPETDMILTRILWLTGEEKKNANTHQRYIYFHGTNREDQIGTPASIGCIRLRNEDIVTLYDLVHIGTPVTILDEPYPVEPTSP